MRTIIIPDIHQRLHILNSILEKESFDEAIFLGDWFDSRVEPPAVATFLETCRTLRSLAGPHQDRHKLVFLIGNHDINYIVHNNRGSTHGSRKYEHCQCSGFSKNKSKQFRKTFFDEGLGDRFFLENFKVAHQSQGYTFSHAGIIEAHLPPNCSIQDFVEEIVPEAWLNFRNLTFSKTSLLYNVGEIRGGRQPFGGLLWLDATEEFTPSPLIGKQIFGHTQFPEPQCFAQGSAFESWAIDTGSHYAVLENGSLQIVKCELPKYLTP